jgi:hypothetical protein
MKSFCTTGIPFNAGFLTCTIFPSLQAMSSQLEASEGRARELYDSNQRLEAHVHDLESRKRAPLYQKKQEEELRAATEKAVEADLRATEAELRTKEAKVGPCCFNICMPWSCGISDPHDFKARWS